MVKKHEPTKSDRPKRSLGERVHDHLVAAEVAAEEAAGYGWATEAVEATEAAVDPDHELGGNDDVRPEHTRSDITKKRKGERTA